MSAIPEKERFQIRVKTLARINENSRGGFSSSPTRGDTKPSTVYCRNVSTYVQTLVCGNFVVFVLRTCRKYAATTAPGCVCLAGSLSLPRR